MMKNFVAVLTAFVLVACSSPVEPNIVPPSPNYTLSGPCISGATLTETLVTVTSAAYRVSWCNLSTTVQVRDILINREQLASVTSRSPMTIAREFLDCEQVANFTAGNSPCERVLPFGVTVKP